MEVKEATIKNLYLPINNASFDITRATHYLDRDTIDAGYGAQYFDELRIRTLSEKIKEVTMDDIEKKFGCKIKIIKEK